MSYYTRTKRKEESWKAYITTFTFNNPLESNKRTHSIYLTRTANLNSSFVLFNRLEERKEVKSEWWRRLYKLKKSKNPKNPKK